MYKKYVPTELDRQQFLKIFGGVYEHSEWIAEKVFDDGLKPDHNNPNHLHLALEKIVNTSKRDKKMDLLLAHPDLAGKIAIRGELTSASTSEQASADLINCTQEEFDEFEQLNQEYKQKFGFPFILAVRGYHRTEILEIFKNRVNNDYETEFNEALQQVHRIALLRLKEIH